MADNFLVANNFLYEPAGAVAPIVTAPVYEARAVFSINASNQLQGTFWVVKNGQHLTSDLGALSFSIRDKEGALIGLAQSGLSADSNGLYKMAAVSAASVLDLTHYTVEISAVAEFTPIKGVVAITLGE